eukprot:Hpha_TRINITY_DN15503_c5_g11::TRINITY_DN15503_c5_g11_i1::g.104662::m.104662
MGRSRDGSRDRDRRRRRDDGSRDRRRRSPASRDKKEDRDKDRDRRRRDDGSRDRRRRSPDRRDRRDRDRRDPSRDKRRRRWSTPSDERRGGRGGGGGDRGGGRNRSPPLTKEEQRDLDEQIDAFADQQDLDANAVTSLRRAVGMPHGREVLKLMLKMDLRAGTTAASRLCMLCLKDASKGVLASQEVKDIVSKFCEDNRLGGRVEVMMLTLNDRQRKMVMDRGPFGDRIKNKGGYLLHLINQAKRDDEDMILEQKEEEERKRQEERRLRDQGAYREGPLPPGATPVAPVVQERGQDALGF